jgi:hypothetical protein
MFIFKNKKKLKSLSVPVSDESLYLCFEQEIDNNEVMKKILLDMMLYKIIEIPKQ